MSAPELLVEKEERHLDVVTDIERLGYTGYYFSFDEKRAASTLNYELHQNPQAFKRRI